MATRVLLLVMMTALFAALWSNDHPGRPATYARKPVDHPAPAVEQEPASIARPRTTPAEPENDAPAGEAAAEIQCALHPLARVVSGKVQREQNRLQLTGAELPLTLVSLPAETEPAERLEPVVAPSAPAVRLFPREGSELDAELFVEIPGVMPSAAAPREVLAEEPAADEAAGLFTDCELPLPERLAAGEYRIVNGDGLVLNRTFSAEDLIWLGATCDSGAERCQQVEADQTVWYFIRVNVEESPQPALPVLTVSAGADTTAAEAGDANPAEEAPVAGAGDVVELAQADFTEQEAALPMESRREVERARAQWLLTGWQLGCQVDWMLRRLSGATRSPGQMLWTAGVRLQQQLAVRQSSEEDRLTESPRADETR